MRRSCITAALIESVGDGIRGDAAFPGDEQGGVSQRRSENETIDGTSLDSRLEQRRADRFWDDLRETFVSSQRSSHT